MNYRSMIAPLAVSTILVGCGNQTSPLYVNAAVSRETRTAALARETGKTGQLFIASVGARTDGSVVVYSGNPLKYSRAVADGIAFPVSIAFNTRQQLFVANGGVEGGHGPDVTIYNRDGLTLTRTLTNKWMNGPQHLAISSKNDLYVDSRTFVNIFVNSRQKQTKKIRHGTLSTIAFDSSNNAYIPVGENTIGVFSPGATKASRAITQGVNGPTALAIDASGNLFVANNQELSCGDITEYDAATGTLENTITDGVCVPRSFAFDSLGNIYVSNGGSGGTGSSITVYSVGTNALSETITKGIYKPSAITIDSSDDLYVADASKVTVYPKGQTNPSQTLTKGIDVPTDIKWLQ